MSTSAATRGITAIASYVPRHRLEHAQLAALVGGRGGRGARAVAGFDEDATTMGVEAARRLLPGIGAELGSLWFSTTRPVHLDKTHATVIAAACGVDRSVGAYDVLGSVRSGAAALRAAAGSSGSALAVLSDLRYGLPGSAETAMGADAAAAIAFGEDPIARLAATVSVSEEFIDRWRPEGEPGPRTWDDRWSLTVYGALVAEVMQRLQAETGIGRDDLTQIVFASPHARAVGNVGGRLGATDMLTGRIGNAGTAQVGLLLQEALRAAAPGDRILVIVAADGADGFLLEVTDRILTARPDPVLDDAPVRVVPPANYFTWRGLFDREPPRRPDPTPPASPPALRNVDWKYAFQASRCTACGSRHLPPQRVCLSCHAVDQMEPEAMQDAIGTVRTFTVDQLAFSLNPPTAVTVLDFDGGGRYRCQMTDVDPDVVAVGDRVEMTFRVIDVAPNGVRNYFWKSRPLVTREATS